MLSAYCSHASTESVEPIIANMAAFPKSLFHFTKGGPGPIDFPPLLPPALKRLLGQQDIMAKDQVGKKIIHPSSAAGD